MKKIFGFNRFVNENYQINEGGGAGIDFKTSNVDVTLKLEMTADELVEKEKSIETADTFDATGYDDGMTDCGMWLLKTYLDVDYNKLKEAISQIPVDAVQGTDFAEEVGIEGKDVKKIGDLFIAQPELVLNINFNISFKNYNEMHFAGYTRGKFKKGAVVIGGPQAKYDTGDYDSITVSDGGHEYELYFDSQVYDLVDFVKPQLMATDTFLKFYETVFDRTNENFDKFIKSELLDNDIDEGDIDEDIQEYIDNNELDITIEEFKKEASKYVNDEFVEFMKGQDDYHTRKWDSYWGDIKDEYGKDNPAGHEQEKDYNEI